RDAPTLDPAERCTAVVGRLRDPTQLGEEATLADPGLADDEGHPAAARLHDVKEVSKTAERLLPPDHRAVETNRIEASPPGRRGLSGDDPVGMDPLGFALDLKAAQVLQLEGVAGQATRHLRDQDSSGLRGGLHPSRDVYGVAEGCVLVAQIRSDVADHDRPAVDPGAD